MIFLANRANLDKRTVLTRLHTKLQTQATAGDSSVERVWYHTSTGNKVGVRATINPELFLGTSYPVETAELQVSFDFPSDYEYDLYTIQWVESERDLMLGWHQDATHMDLGKCHFQLDYRGKTVQRAGVSYIDAHPLNVFDQRVGDLVGVLEAMGWGDDVPRVPESLFR